MLYAAHKQNSEVNALSEEVVDELERLTGLGAHAASSVCWGAKRQEPVGDVSQTADDDDDSDGAVRLLWARVWMLLDDSGYSCHFTYGGGV